MDVLIILRGACDVGEIAAGAMLTAFWLARCSAGVHQEKRIFGLHRNGFDDAIAIILNDVVHEIIAVHDHRRIGSKSVRDNAARPAPCRCAGLPFWRWQRRCRRCLVIDPPAVAMIAVGINQNAAARIRRAQSAGFAGETAEDHGMNHAQPRAGQHRDRQLGNHRHVNGDAIAFLQAGKIAQHGGNFIHSDDRVPGR